MVFPIQYALAWPERWENRFARLRLDELGALESSGRSTTERFPAVDLARRALEAGESAPAVLNAANEVAVEAFLAGRAAFTAIVPTVERVLAAHRPVALGSLEDALEWDAWARRQAREALGE